MSVYIVIMEAVYDHGVYGVFDTEEAAMTHAAALWKDSDGHHRYRVEMWPLNEPLIPTDDKRWGWHSGIRELRTDEPMIERLDYNSNVPQ